MNPVSCEYPEPSPECEHADGGSVDDGGLRPDDGGADPDDGGVAHDGGDGWWGPHPATLCGCRAGWGAPVGLLPLVLLALVARRRRCERARAP